MEISWLSGSDDSGLTRLAARWRPLRVGIALLFFSAVLLFFFPSFSSYFVCDDFEFLGRVNFHDAGQYFLKSWGYGNEYRPLLVYTYALNGLLGGFNPAGYHLINSALHALNGIIVVLILRLLGFDLVLALLAASLFVLNPVTHESVLWIAGRPVLLSTLFVLSSVWCFLKADRSPKRSPLYFAGMYVSSVLALLSYEGAVVTPFLIAICAGGFAARRHWRQIVALLCLLFVYIIFWNVLFGFRITRFPTEHSTMAAFGSLRNAVENSFHGSGRLWVAPLYLGLLYCALREKISRGLLLTAAGWFLICYLPFFLVHGYADRFSYLGSASVAVVLAFSLVAMSRRSRWWGLAAAAALILFFAVGMQNRITIWRQAGQIARGIIADVKEARPSMPPHSTVVVLGVPSTYKQAMVFLTGIERAIALQYPGTPLLILRRNWPDMPRPVIVFTWINGHMREASLLSRY